MSLQAKTTKKIVLRLQCQVCKAVHMHALKVRLVCQPHAQRALDRFNTHQCLFGISICMQTSPASECRLAHCLDALCVMLWQILEEPNHAQAFHAFGFVQSASLPMLHCFMCRDKHCSSQLEHKIGRRVAQCPQISVSSHLCVLSSSREHSTLSLSAKGHRSVNAR